MEREILGFLCKTWGEDKEVELKEIEKEQFSVTTGEKNKVVFYPKFDDGLLFPSFRDFNRWRLWRFGIFHESGHVKFTPKSTPDVIENILEDFRIEHNMLILYPGYISEQAWEKASSYVIRPSLDKLPDKVIVLIEYLLQKVLMGESKGVSTLLTLEDTAWIDNFVNEWKVMVKNIASFEDTVKKSDEFRSHFKLDEPCNGAIPSTKARETFGGDSYPIKQKEPPQKSKVEFEKEVEEQLEKMVKEGKLTEEQTKPNELIKEEFESLMKEKKEAEKIEDLVREVRNKTKINVRYVRARKTEPLSISSLQSPIVKLVSELQRWKIGWKEILDDKGEEFEIEEYILKQKKYFYDEQKEGVRGKVAVILDASSSIFFNGLEEGYKHMAVIVGEALSKLKIKFTMHAFHYLSDGDVNQIYSIKELGENWTQTNTEKVMGLFFGSRGHGTGTPTGSVLEFMDKFTSKFGIDKIVVLTDGMPTPLEEEQMCVKMMPTLKRKKDVYWILLGKTYCGEKITKKISPTDYIVIDSVNEIPRAFFRIINKSRSIV